MSYGSQTLNSRLSDKGIDFVGVPGSPKSQSQVQKSIAVAIELGEVSGLSLTEGLE